MTLCKICGTNTGIYKVRDVLTGEIFCLCEFCDEPMNVELIEGNLVMKNEEIEYGRLHCVRKTQKEFKCRICGEEIPRGSSCYTQSIHRKPFPIQTRVCLECGIELVKNGAKVT